MTNSIEIYAAKWKLYLTLSLSLLWLCLIILAILNPGEDQIDLSIFLIAGLPLIGIMFSISLIRNRKPVISISESDLILTRPKITIPLNQIAKVRLRKRRFTPMAPLMRTVDIALHDRDALLPPITKMRKRLANVALRGYHVMIPVYGLEKSPKEIYELIRTRANLPIEPS